MKSILNKCNFTLSTKWRHRSYSQAKNKGRTTNFIRHNDKLLKSDPKFKLKYEQWKCNFAYIMINLALKTHVKCYYTFHNWLVKGYEKMWIDLLKLRFWIVRYTDYINNVWLMSLCSCFFPLFLIGIQLSHFQW